MLLLKEAFVVNGGCGCGAVRYKLSIPEPIQRPLYPYSQKSGRGEEVRLPMARVDHPNDCWRATGNLLPFRIREPVVFVTAPLIPRFSAARKRTPPRERSRAALGRPRRRYSCQSPKP